MPVAVTLTAAFDVDGAGGALAVASDGIAATAVQASSTPRTRRMAMRWIEVIVAVQRPGARGERRARSSMKCDMHGVPA